MFTMQLGLGLGLGLGGAGAGEGELVPGDDRAVGGWLAEGLCRLVGWRAAGAGPLETTRLTAEPFETCVPFGGFVEITSFVATDADAV